MWIENCEMHLVAQNFILGQLNYTQANMNERGCIHNKARGQHKWESKQHGI